MIYSSLLRIGVICLPGYAAAVDVTKTDNPIADQYIVTTLPGTLLENDGDIGASSVEDNVLKIIGGGAPDGVGAASHGEVRQMYTSAMEGFTAVLDSVGLQNVLNNPKVTGVEQDGYVHIDQTQVTWGLDRIDEENLPLDKKYNPTFGKDGEGVTAYIIDTGILASHTEFENRATQEFNSAGDGKNEDCNGHGTHVAGTIGSKTYGVANKVKLVGVKVLACNGGGSWSGVIAGIDWVKANAKKPATANLSLGGGKNSAINIAIKNLHDSGVTTVVAAGNSNANACLYSPASEPTAITVGSTTITDARSSFSNWGTCVDIFAPGSDITAPWIGSNTALKTISGTSMASPHVCGGAALYLGQYPNITPEEVLEKMIEDSIADTISGVGTGSPNKFLHVGSNQAPTVSPAPTRTVTSTPTKPPTQGSDGYRIYAPTKWIVRNVWDVRNVKFFPNSDCTGKLIRDGKAMSSGHYPSNDWKAENAFGDDNNRGWGGRHKNGVYWLGMEFNGGRSVECVSFLDMDAKSGARGVTVQHKKNGAWEDIITLENISPGVRHNIPLGRTCSNGRLLLEIDVTTGNSGKENTVSVKRMGKDGWAKRKSMYYEGFDDNSMKKLTHCLHPDKCYKIAIKDRGGDGMTDGDGSYIIKADGDIIKESEFVTGRKEETLFNC